MVLASALLHAAWNAWAKGARDPTAFLACLSVAHVLPALALPWLHLEALPLRMWAILPLSALVHVAYQVFLSRAYQVGDLSVVYPIARSTPALVAAVAIPLGDAVTGLGIAGIAVVVAGVWLVHTQGHLDPRSLVRSPGIGWAYATLVATAGYSLLDKEAMRGLGEHTDPLTGAVAFYLLLTIAHSLGFVPWAIATRGLDALRTSARTERRLLATGLAAMMASYVLILVALQTASVSYVTAVRQTSVAFAAALGVLLLGERPGRWRIAGAGLTVVGVALIAFAA